MRKKESFMKRKVKMIRNIFAKIALMIADAFAFKHYRLSKKLVMEELDPLITTDKEEIHEKLSVTEKNRLVYQYIFFNEFIIRSACALKVDDVIEKVFSVKAPGHHHEVLLFWHHYYSNSEEKSPDRKNRVQGFLTNKGRFVQREEAYLIALTAKQIVSQVGNGKDLFSEQLWSLTGENYRFKQLYTNSRLTRIEQYFRSIYRRFKSN